MEDKKKKKIIEKILMINLIYIVAVQVIIYIISKNLTFEHSWTGYFKIEWHFNISLMITIVHCLLMILYYKAKEFEKIIIIITGVLIIISLFIPVFDISKQSVSYKSLEETHYTADVPDEVVSSYNRSNIYLIPIDREKERTDY